MIIIQGNINYDLRYMGCKIIIQMVIYSGFSSRRHQQKYNQLIKELLHLMSQMIITYVESTKIMAFKQSYQKIQFQISKMDQYKYSDIKVSAEIDALTQHIINGDLATQIMNQPIKRKTDHRTAFRTKRNTIDIPARNIQSAKVRPKEQKRRSLSMTTDKNMTRHSIGEAQLFSQPTMQQLMRMHPLIERKMSNIRKKRYLKQRNSNSFAQIQEQDEQGEDKQ